MVGIIGWLKRRRERKVQEDEKLDERLRECFAGINCSKITVGRIDASLIVLCPECGAFRGKGKGCVCCG